MLVCVCECVCGRCTCVCVVVGVRVFVRVHVCVVGIQSTIQLLYRYESEKFTQNIVERGCQKDGEEGSRRALFWQGWLQGSCHHC